VTQQALGAFVAQLDREMLPATLHRPISPEVFQRVPQGHVARAQRRGVGQLQHARRQGRHEALEVVAQGLVGQWLGQLPQPQAPARRRQLAGEA
jgi:hypothetical protein